MGPSFPSDSQRARQEQTFAQLFGVTEEELVRQGIDLDEYFSAHIGEALKDRRKWDLVLPKSQQYNMLWPRWGFRAFLAMFVGFGFLALSEIPAVHWPAIGAAAAIFVVVLIMSVMMWTYRAKSARASRTEGANGRTRGSKT